MERLLECVPNFSEGRDKSIIDAIVKAIASVENVYVLDVDPGESTNRTVVTFVGEPEAVIEAAYQGIAKAAELIDMRFHQGEHPRMGATDVCPLIPIQGIDDEEAIALAHRLAKRVGETLNIPVYLYEKAATRPERKNLATIRAGEYEGLPQKLKDPKWKPDYGPATFNAKSGATAIGVRDFLIAYNLNLNTKSVRRANSLAFDLREKGRVKRKGNPITGEIVRDEQGNPVRIPGKLKGVKAIGWYIEEYGIAQVSMNITNIKETPLHYVFEVAQECALKRGLRITGSEIVGMVPRQVLIEAGKYFLRKQNRSAGVSEKELVFIAVKSLGLDDLYPFDPTEKVIEYKLEKLRRRKKLLIERGVEDFVDEVASESAAPGGGSVAALMASLGAALGSMVANLTAEKERGEPEKLQYFGNFAEQFQDFKARCLRLVDEDTRAFEQVMQAFRMPAKNEEERQQKQKRIEEATLYAAQVPLQVMRQCIAVYPLLEKMADEGNPNSITDVGVGALALHAAVEGAALNVLINLKSLESEQVKTMKQEVEELRKRSQILKESILKKVYALL